MASGIIRGILYFIIFMLIQVLILNNISFLRIATPFLYLYFLMKMPVGISTSAMLILSFFTGLVLDMFTNTPGIHAAACTFAGFYRENLIQLFIGKDLMGGVYPSINVFGLGGFLRYTLSFVALHHIILFLVEAFTLFDALFLVIRILSSMAITVLFIFIVEAFNMETVRNVDK
jgi:rod shape-determining protein MreD